MDKKGISLLKGVFHLSSFNKVGVEERRLMREREEEQEVGNEGRRREMEFAADAL
jgi:hypothetical protein